MVLRAREIVGEWLANDEWQAGYMGTGWEPCCGSISDLPGTSIRWKWAPDIQITTLIRKLDIWQPIEKCLSDANLKYNFLVWLGLIFGENSIILAKNWGKVVSSNCGGLGQVYLFFWLQFCFLLSSIFGGSVEQQCGRRFPEANACCLEM